MTSYSKRKWLAILNSERISKVEIPDVRSYSDSYITVGTWNILAQSLTLKERYPYSSSDALNKNLRTERTLDEISEFRPDILMLQEVEPLSYYSDTLHKLGYKCTSYRRPDAEDGCMILYKSDKFDFHKSIRFNLDNDHFSTVGKDDGVYQIRTKSIGILALLGHIETKKRVIVGTAHMYWHPNADVVRLRQWLFYLQMLEKIEKDPYKYQTILAADFNTRPDDIVCLLISGEKTSEQLLNTPIHQGYSFMPITPEEQEVYESCIKSIYISKVQPSLEQILKQWSDLHAPNLISIYPYSLRDETGANSLKSSNTCYNLRRAFIDHIFISKTHYYPVALLELPTEEECSVQKALPNDNYPSDHIPLGAVIAIP